MIQHWASDANALQFDYSVRFSGFGKGWGRYIVNGNAGRRFTLEHPIVRVTMKHRRGAESIDRFLETTGTEKSVDFGSSPCNVARIGE
jgi:hypothetical protein